LLELIGTAKNGVYRMEINHEVLDTGNQSKRTEDNIPLKCLDDFYTYDEIVEYFASQVNHITHDVDPYAAEELELSIVEGKYYIGCLIHRLCGQSTYMMAYIHLDDGEELVVNQVLVA
jgi:hypothetical protein